MRSWRKNAGLAMISFCLIILFATLSQAADDFSDTPEVTEEVLGLKDALMIGLQKNLSLKAEKLNVPMGREAVTIEQATFDPVIEASADAEKQNRLTGVVLYEGQYQEHDAVKGGIAIQKLFRTGLRTRMAFETIRSSNNTLADTLNTQYRNVVLLTLTQPLLRDFGVDTNTTGIRISQILERQAFLEYADQAQSLAEGIEMAYYEVSKARAELQLKIKLRDLARDLIRGNQERLAGALFRCRKFTRPRLLKPGARRPSFMPGRNWKLPRTV